MVSFQCEDCGENLKQPNLRKHFSTCSATKLSCIDCGNLFVQDNAVSHNQCITESEKYGPKKPNSKREINFDRDAAVSNGPSWFCSLCNIKTSCEKNFVSHVRGRKHLAKAKGLLHTNQQQSERSSMDNKGTVKNASNGDGDSKQKKLDLHVSSGVANGCYSQPDKKRKLETFYGNMEVIQSKEAEEGAEKKVKKQTESDSDFEYDKEDMKLQLASYSKEELVYLIYKTVEKDSRLMSTILESTEHDITQRNIVVRGFGWDTTHESLKAAFESYGEIEDCSVVMDKDTGRSKGYGFVLFKMRKGAREALKNPEKMMYNRTVVCNLASANTCEPALPGIELDHGHVLEKRHQQLTMEMYDQNVTFYGHSQRPGFDSMYGVLRGNHMVTGPPNYRMFGSGLMNQGSVAPSNHVGMTRDFFW